MKGQRAVGLLFALMLSICTYGQTWTGAVDSIWDNAANWSTNTVPTSVDNVIIPNVTRDPYISSTAHARRVLVEAGGDLTILSPDSLVIVGGGAASYSIKNEGDVVNYGNIYIGVSAVTTTTGIENLSVFKNKTGGKISIDQTTLHGIYNNNSAIFTNEDIICIGTTSGTALYGIFNDGGSTFNNLSGGRIAVNRSTSDGILNFHHFYNEGDLYIGEIAANGANGIQSNVLFTNAVGGKIKIFRSTDIGINLEAGTFINADSITIGVTHGVGRYGFYAQGNFRNNAGGILHINRASSTGYWQLSGTLTNKSEITIGDISVGVTINNQGTINNDSTGVMYLDRGTLNNSGTLVNRNIIHIGANASVGNTGIFNQGSASVIMNKFGATINVNRSTGSAISGNGTSDFTNEGTVNIGAIALSGDGITLSNFNNETTGIVNIDRASKGLGGTFINKGKLTIGALVAVPTLMSGSLDNRLGGILHGSGIIGPTNMTNSGGIISPGYDAPGIISYSATPETNLSNSILRMDINGTGTAGIDYDLIERTNGGPVRLGGTLELEIGYTPIIGDQVTIVDGAFVIFDTFTGVTGMSDGWTVSYDSPGKVILTFGHSWTGAIDSDWHTAGNWSPMEVPTSASSVGITDVANDPIISALAEIKNLIIAPGAVLTLEADDTLRINGAAQHGLLNQGTTDIKGDLLIGDLIPIGDYGIRNEDLLVHSIGGTIQIDQCTLGGIENVAGATINNLSEIVLGAVGTVGLSGIVNAGMFNHFSGNMNIDRCTAQGIHNVANGIFSNQSAIQIGSAFPVGSYGVLNQAQFNNQLGATINLDNYSLGGFFHSLGHFMNQGLIESMLPSGGQFIFEADSLADIDAEGEVRIGN